MFFLSFFVIFDLFCLFKVYGTCQSRNKLKNYYDVLFPWLEKCEKLFGSEDLRGYGKIRIYAFLAERYQSYWFNKYTKPLLWPVIFYDITKTIKE